MEEPPTIDAVRVHLADDHIIFREGLEAILSSREGVEVVGRSSTGEEASSQVGKTKPDLVITELDMQIKGAQEILEGIREASPDSRIVVLTMQDSLHYLKALSRMGIDAYIHKTSSKEELMATIDALSRQASADGQKVVVSMPRGLTNDRIAEELHLAPATVKRHLANVYQKIGVRSRSEAVRRALMEQWIGIGEITSPDGSDGSDGSSGG